MDITDIHMSPNQSYIFVILFTDKRCGQNKKANLKCYYQLPITKQVISKT